MLNAFRPMSVWEWSACWLHVFMSSFYRKIANYCSELSLAEWRTLCFCTVDVMQLSVDPVFFQSRSLWRCLSEGSPAKRRIIPVMAFYCLTSIGCVCFLYEIHNVLKGKLREIPPSRRRGQRRTVRWPTPPGVGWSQSPACQPEPEATVHLG